MSKILHPSLASLLCLNALAAEQMPSWTPSSMMAVKQISEIAISPDNESIVFVEVCGTVDDKNEYSFQIFKTKTDGSQAPSLLISNNTEASHPKWSPDGTQIAFLSDKKLCIVSKEGKEILTLVDGKNSVQTFLWSPDGKKIAFVMSDEDPKSDEPIEYKNEKGRNRLWIVDIKGSEPKPITPKSYHVRGAGDFGTRNEEFDWAPDGKTIVFSYSPYPGLDHYHLDASLASLNVSTLEVTVFEKKNSYEANPRFSPDGTRIAYVTSDGTSTYMYDRYVATRSYLGDDYKRLAPTFNEGPNLGGPNLLGWTSEGKQVVFYEPKRTGFHLCFLPLTGESATELNPFSNYFNAPCLSPDGTTFAAAVQSSCLPPEVYITRLDSLEPKQLSRTNESFLSLPIPETKIIKWSSTDGMEIEGLLTYPIAYDSKKTYPLLLVIHGGPMSFSEDTFIGSAYPYPLACFAEAGFMILKPNPRGSTGYGKSFRSANAQDWGGMDFYDLMTGVNSLIAKGLVDSNKTGVMGWSYGGFMTAWIVTQTNAFKAASIGAAPIHWMSMSGTTDLHRIVSDYLGSSKQKALYEERSPLYFVDKVNTPCLIQHGIDDLRVPLSQAYELYHALDRAGKKPVLMLYSDTTHYFEKPKQELRAMEKNLEWFKKHLLEI